MNSGILVNTGGLDFVDHQSIIARMAPVDWNTVDDVAARLGAGPYARLQWRQRRIPDGWKIKIVETLKAEGKRVGFADLPKGKREAA